MYTKKIKSKTIMFKTLSILVVFSVAILLILWAFQLLFIKTSYEKYTITKMNNIKAIIEKTSSDELDSVLENLAYDNDVCIEYLTTNQFQGFNTQTRGCLLGRSNTKINAYKKLLLNNPKIGKIELNNPNLNTKSLLYGIKLDNGFVFVSTNLEDINTTTVALTNQLIYITLIVMILAIFISYYISRKITSPIVSITKSAKKLGDGDYNVTFKKNGTYEIDELAETLNHTKNELANTMQVRRDLMANVSHDLKTPLTMIKAYAEMVKDYTYKDAKKRNENLDIIIKETDRLNELVNDILDLSKLQANKEELNFIEFDLIKTVKEILKRYEHLKKDGYEFILTSPRKVLVKADKSKIEQVIYNLINNAINYTGKDQKVYINIVKTDRILVEIKDTGKGIDEKDLKYIWDKYYKSNKNHKRNVHGTGIGLSIVKEILLFHHYEYGVKSTKGKGTTFYFYINM